MDPIMINRLGQIRQQEILEQAARDYTEKSPLRFPLLTSVRLLIRQIRRGFAVQPSRQQTPQFTIDDCLPECE